MSGLVGLITMRPRPQAEHDLARMVAAIRHESTWPTATFMDERLGVYLGWIVRPTGIDAGMPLCTERNDRILVFCGEEYPAPDTRRRLRALGHDLPADGPSYLAHLAEDDDEFPSGLNGRFHGCLVDRIRASVTLFTDRYGVHRLYWHDGGDTFYFAAEAKAIVGVRPDSRTLDARGLGEYIACGCVLDNRTLFSNIHALPPASAWVFRHGALSRKHTYFEPRAWETQTPLDAEPYYHELRTTFSENLPRYFSGHEPIGISLTGGLDTRMIVAWQQAAARSLRCYTFGGMLRESRDVILAREVARVAGQPHEVIPVGREFLARFAHYAERAVFLSDGRAGVNHAADLYVNQRAARIAPVRVTGTFGSELLRGIRAFKPVEPTPGVYQPEVMPHVRAAHHTYQRMLRGHPLSFALFQQAPWHHGGLLGLEHTQLAVRAPFLDNDLVRLVFRAPVRPRARTEICLRLVADGNPALRRIPTDRGEGGSRGLATALSRQWRALEFKAEYHLGDRMPQRLARFAGFGPLRGWETPWLGRHKFQHFRLWYRSELAAYVRDVLLDPRALSRSYLQRRAVERIVRDHLRGVRNCTAELHRLLTLELCHRLFLDGPARGAGHAESPGTG